MDVEWVSYFYGYVCEDEVGFGCLVRRMFVGGVVGVFCSCYVFGGRIVSRIDFKSGGV